MSHQRSQPPSGPRGCPRSPAWSGSVSQAGSAGPTRRLPPPLAARSGAVKAGQASQESPGRLSIKNCWTVAKSACEIALRLRGAVEGSEAGRQRLLRTHPSSPTQQTRGTSPGSAPGAQAQKARGRPPAGGDQPGRWAELRAGETRPPGPWGCRSGGHAPQPGWALGFLTQNGNDNTDLVSMERKMDGTVLCGGKPLYRDEVVFIPGHLGSVSFASH